MSAAEKCIVEDLPNSDRLRKLLIIGGGFAGIRLAQRIERKLPHNWAVTLVSQENFITYNPLLPEVVGASLLPGHVVAPLRQMVRRARIFMATVSGIDLESKTVEYLGEGSGTLDYDQLVIACGVNANLALVKGMAQYALPLKTLGDALFLRNRLVARLEQAELQEDPEQRHWLTTFVVIGGGFSGVETAGEILDFLRASARYYSRIEPDDCRVVLLHGSDRLLPELRPGLGEFAARKMTKHGVDVRLNSRATRVDDRAVTLESGERISAGTIICTIGTAENPMVSSISTVESVRGRIKTNPDMSVPGHPGVWALGDCAAVPNAYADGICPPTAQFADRQAGQLADNILASLAGAETRPFRYKPSGQLSSIGHNKAVAQIFGLRLSGFFAWLLWRGLYLLKIPTLSRKVRLFLEWNWAMFFPPDISHFGYRRTKRRATAKPKAAVTG